MPKGGIGIVLNPMNKAVELFNFDLMKATALSHAKKEKMAKPKSKKRDFSQIALGVVEKAKDGKLRGTRWGF